MEHKYAGVFNEPVDAEKLDIPDYPVFIKEPMDLGTVKAKLHRQEYKTLPLDFASDVRLTFKNAMLYNPPGHEVHHMASKLLAIFEKKWKALNKAKLTPTPEPNQPTVRAMSFEEKYKLLEDLQVLPEHMQHATIMLIKERSPQVDWSGDEIDVCLDLFDNQTLWELDGHIKQCMKSVVPSDKRVMQPMDSNKVHSKSEKQEGDEDIGILINIPNSIFSDHKDQ